jgi:hypothetical protein
MGAARAAGAHAPQLPGFIKEIIATAITDVFSMGIYVVAAALLVVLLIPHTPLRDRSAFGAQASPKKEDPDTVIPAEAHL